MKRRTYLSAVASAGVGLLGGCQATDGGTPAGGTPSTPGTGSPSPVPLQTPAPGQCAATTPPAPFTGEGLPVLRSYPSKPDLADPSAVRTFLEEYEAAYLYNARLAELAADGHCVEYLDTFVTDSTLTDVDGGFAGAVTTRGSYTGATCPGESGTPLPHRDFGYRTAHYRVTERFLQRGNLVLACWG